MINKFTIFVLFWLGIIGALPMTSAQAAETAEYLESDQFNNILERIMKKLNGAPIDGNNGSVAVAAENQMKNEIASLNQRIFHFRNEKLRLEELIRNYALIVAKDERKIEIELMVNERNLLSKQLDDAHRINLLLTRKIDENKENLEA